MPKMGTYSEYDELAEDAKQAKERQQQADTIPDPGYSGVHAELANYIAQGLQFATHAPITSDSSKVQLLLSGLRVIVGQLEASQTKTRRRRTKRVTEEDSAKPTKVKSTRKAHKRGRPPVINAEEFEVD
jgi:hypothetical protein